MLLSLVVYGNYGSDGKFGNVAIKRGQSLLADYAEQKQRKDCEAGLILGVIGVIGVMGIIGIMRKSIRLFE